MSGGDKGAARCLPSREASAWRAEGGAGREAGETARAGGSSRPSRFARSSSNVIFQGHLVAAGTDETRGLLESYGRVLPCVGLPAKALDFPSPSQGKGTGWGADQCFALVQTFNLL